MKSIKRKYKVIGWILFIVYLFLLVYFLFFAESMGRTDRSTTATYNLHLFREIMRFWQYRHIVGIKAFLLNTVGNVIAFIPLGFLIPILISSETKKYMLFRTVLCGALFSLCVELAQLYLNVGSFDVDDILLNTVGTVVGYIFFRILFRRD